MRRFLFLFSYLLFPLVLLAPAIAAAQDAGVSSSSSNNLPEAPSTQDSRRFDVALSAFGQVTGASNGNSVREDTTESMGGLVSFRQPYRPWLGYEVDYGVTRYSEFYNKATTVQNNVSEFTAAYLLQTARPYYGFQPFLTVGTGIIIFAPISANINLPSPQVLPLFVYSLGFNHLILSDHIGIRVQYRAIKYKTPDYGQFLLNSQSLRTTMEPAIGAYYRF